MKGAFKFGTIAGINIFIHWTFGILIAYIIIRDYRAGQNALQILWSVLFVLSIFITVLLHEIGHALAAKRFNIKTQDITLLPIGGMARLESLPEKPKEELLVAIAGPAVNIALAILTGLFITLPNDSNQFITLLSNGVNSTNFMLAFCVVNIWLAAFNFIPAFPMDGGRVLRALLAMKFKRPFATKIAARIGQIIALGFIFLGFYYNPILIFIGLFVMIGAQAESEYTQLQSMLKGYVVKDVLIKNYQALDADQTIKTAVKMLLDGQIKNFLVTEESNPTGTLSRNEIIKALTDQGDQEIIRNVMDRNLIFLKADLPLQEAFQRAQQNKSNLMPVMENNQLIGVLDTENILEFIMINHSKEK